MNPSEFYQYKQTQLDLMKDPAQSAILEQLDIVCAQLKAQSSRQKNLFNRFLKRKPPERIKGIYLWGGVGRGKTMLMDIFYDCLPTKNKRRTHFHRFMQDMHQTLKQHRDIENPLDKVADTIAQQCSTLCLDEFHVNDITDAMLLSGLLNALFKRQLCLITTSNQMPDDLYKGGLQRLRFLPAIQQLKNHCHIIQLDNLIDYRLRTLQKNELYLHPHDENTEQAMQHLFATLTANTHHQSILLTINGRAIPAKGEAEGTVWFEFDTLCNSPRSQYDYLEIACEHHSVFLSKLPQMNDESNDAARRFLNLIDILYDHRVKLIMSGESPLISIYTGSKLTFEYERAISRLIEMQSQEYLQKAHQP